MLGCIACYRVEGSGQFSPGRAAAARHMGPPSEQNPVIMRHGVRLLRASRDAHVLGLGMALAMVMAMGDGICAKAYTNCNYDWNTVLSFGN